LWHRGIPTASSPSFRSFTRHERAIHWRKSRADRLAQAKLVVHRITRVSFLPAPEPLALAA